MNHRHPLRRQLLLALALGGLVLAAGLALAARQREVPACTSQEDPVSILVATDLHYLSPRLTDGGAAFQQVAAQGDGLATAYLSQVTEAFVAQVLAIQPDLLILSGDLTFNGAAASHADLGEQLAPLQAAGIQVLVLPGNHDLNNPNAAYFAGDPIDQTEFAQGLALWEGQAPSFYTAYLQSILEDGGSGYHTAQLTRKTGAP